MLKIDEIWIIASKIKAAAIVMSESKLDNIVPDNEVSIEGYMGICY